MTMENEIRAVIDKFHKKVESDPELKKELMPIKKTINMDLGEEAYGFRIEDYYEDEDGEYTDEYVEEEYAGDGDGQDS